MQNIICPVCSEALNEIDSGKSFRCENGHLFDKAKQGYVNLLLSHQKKSKQPGDTIEMVAARTEFLNKGYYTPVANKLLEIAKSHQLTQSQSEPIKYCDIACGEGYYTQLLNFGFAEVGPVLTTGFDISTPAVKAATRRDKSLQWLIASANKIPIEPNSQDILTCLFCRVDYKAAAIVSKPNALFIVAETGPQHLIELRDELYEEVSPEKPKEDVQDQNGFRLLRTEELLTNAHIDSSADILNLLTMTPHFWRVKPDKKKALEQLNQLNVTLDIRFHVFQAT